MRAMFTFTVIGVPSLALAGATLAAAANKASARQAVRNLGDMKQTRYWRRKAQFPPEW
jgi:hypothetical protein